MPHRTPPPRPVRTFFLLLAPMVVIGFMLGGKILPGPGALVGAVAGAVAAALMAVRWPHWGSLAGRPHLILSFLAWLMLLVVVVVAGVFHFHTEEGSPFCAETPFLMKVERCEGRDHSMLQGRLSFSEASGRANAAQCQILMKELAEQGPVAKIPDDKAWHRVTCPPWSDGPWTCIGKREVSAGHDTRRVLYGFSADCQRGRAWSSTNVTFSEMPQKLSNVR